MLLLLFVEISDILEENVSLDAGTIKEGMVNEGKKISFSDPPMTHTEYINDESTVTKHSNCENTSTTNDNIDLISK